MKERQPVTGLITEDGYLIIRVPFLPTARLSSNGTSWLLCTTSGFVPLYDKSGAPILVRNRPLAVGINVTIRRDPVGEDSSVAPFDVIKEIRKAKEDLKIYQESDHQEVSDE